MNTPQGILQAGELLNNTYIIEKLIGSGGTGEVYLAKNVVSGRKFAIKILKQEFSQNEAFINLMRREADVLHNVIDDAVVRYNELLKSEMHGGFVFLVMEYIEGPSLADLMQERGPIDAESLLLIAQRAGKGLMAAHAQNAFHRDISPDNFILPDGDPARAKLIDFGIARDISENAQTVVGGGFAGKYQYASPEQLNGDADARSDLYSLGITLLNAYRGKANRVGSSLMEIVKAKAERVDARDVPGRLGALISRLAEPAPEDRFQSAAEMLQWLEGAPLAPARPVDFEPTIIAPSRPTTGFQGLPDEPKASGGGGKFALLLFLAALGAGGWYFGLGPGREIVFPPKFERETPYSIRILHEANTRDIRISGNVRGPELGDSLVAELGQGFDGYGIIPDFTYASGEPNERWEQISASMAKLAAPLNSWVFEMVDETATLSGEAPDAITAGEVRLGFENNAALLDVEAVISLTIAEPPVLLADLNELIQTYETCGPLRITGGDGVQLGIDDRITVSGIIARESDVDVFDLVLEEATGGRGIDYNLGVLNEPVCLMESLLPPPQDNGMEILYSYGQKAGGPGAAPFRNGENPVIEVRLPASATGFLYAFYVDAEGQVFHLLPHQSRQAHTLPPIGEISGDQVTVRLSYPVSEASTSNVGFRVVEPFGTNMMVVVLSREPLFDGLRPRAESIAALQEALDENRDILQADSTMVVSRYLVTEP